MKNKLLCVLLIGILVLGITGCGNSVSSSIVKDFNDTIDEEVALWQEREYGATLSVYYIQNSLEKKDLQYVIVASGDKEFTSAPDFTEYKESNISNYDGTSYSNMRMLEEEMSVKYFVVYEESSGKYYNLKVSYEKVNLNGAEKEYPVFSDAKELK